ncbi:protein phosphatase CheZ [Salinarimonas chemoclinalis]|uniref:protein phosphatase CheZ n=1 Tax=Salinarimonas chemoclinalis TaxID=3241599 RepID=UPI003555E8A1
MATASAQRMRTSTRPRGALIDPDGIDLKMVARELEAVADYVTNIKREIGALRANELYRARLPVAHDELGNVVDATQSATNTIMAAAEEILGSAEDDFETYRAFVQDKVTQIFEACSFQDITGQRINKVVDELAQVEKRLSRFAAAVNMRDQAAQVDPEDAAKQARKEALILNGPQTADLAVSQDDIDALFG